VLWGHRLAAERNGEPSSLLPRGGEDDRITLFPNITEELTMEGERAYLSGLLEANNFVSLRKGRITQGVRDDCLLFPWEERGKAALLRSERTKGDERTT